MNARTVSYWVSTLLFTLGMLGSGSMNLLREPNLMAQFERLGFPSWFPLWLGGWKVLGALVLLAPGLPRAKEWATAGFVIAMSSAVAAHLAAGDAPGVATAPALLLALAMASWALRPASRRTMPASGGSDLVAGPASVILPE